MRPGWKSGSAIGYGGRRWNDGRPEGSRRNRDTDTVPVAGSQSLTHTASAFVWLSKACEQ